MTRICNKKQEFEVHRNELQQLQLKGLLVPKRYPENALPRKMPAKRPSFGVILLSLRQLHLKRRSQFAGRVSSQGAKAL
jgi:hypothetical protein